MLRSGPETRVVVTGRVMAAAETLTKQVVGARRGGGREGEGGGVTGEEELFIDGEVGVADLEAGEDVGVAGGGPVEGGRVGGGGGVGGGVDGDDGDGVGVDGGEVGGEIVVGSALGEGPGFGGVGVELFEIGEGGEGFRDGVGGIVGGEALGAVGALEGGAGGAGGIEVKGSDDAGGRGIADGGGGAVEFEHPGGAGGVCGGGEEEEGGEGFFEEGGGTHGNSRWEEQMGDVLRVPLEGTTIR